MSRVIVITGGASGIGREIVRGFINEGATTYVIDIDREGLESLTKEYDNKVIPFVGDLQDPQAITDFAKFILGREKSIDCLINNACITRRGILSGCSYEDFLYVQKVGVVAPYMLTMLLKDHFVTMGSVVNISSSRAFQSQPDTESYSAAKGGITALTHSLAMSLAGRVRVNSISPGWIDTSNGEYVFDQSDLNQHPSARVGRPSDIFNAVKFLCDPQNSFITAENIMVDGGMSHLMVYHNDQGWTLN